MYKEKDKYNLYYSQKEKILFWISGLKNSTNIVEEIVEDLTKKAEAFIELGEVKDSEKSRIQTFTLKDSSSYPYNDIFFLATDIIPLKASILEDNQSMINFLRF